MSDRSLGRRLPTSILRQIETAKIKANPENPRLIFRQEEMESLLVSIDKNGIQVPVSVYQDGAVYFLIDGERRWRCARKLGLRTVPALIQEKPSELDNLVLMYNIHALREQWDYFTIASKLERVIELRASDVGQPPNERELSELTGLTVGAIRRCQLLIKLPEKYKQTLLEELEKPKAQQKITEDFLIEMERALKAVTIRLPEYEERIDDIRDALISKFRGGIIQAITDFRQLSKIATAIDKLGLAHKTARRALDKVFDESKAVGIRQAYDQTVQFDYFERKAEREVGHLVDFIETVLEEGRASEVDEKTRIEFEHLRDKIVELLAEIEEIAE